MYKLVIMMIVSCAGDNDQFPDSNDEDYDEACDDYDYDDDDGHDDYYA